MNIEKFKLSFPKKFETLKDIPEFPRTESEEDFKQLVKLFIDAGAISKKDLIPGGWYLGNCRNASVAQWWPVGGFHYIRYKMGGMYIDKIHHFEDDDGYDVFIPFKLLYNDEDE